MYLHTLKANKSNVPQSIIGLGEHQLINIEKEVEQVDQKVTSRMNKNDSSSFQYKLLQIIHYSLYFLHYLLIFSIIIISLGTIIITYENEIPKGINYLKCQLGINSQSCNNNKFESIQEFNDELSSIMNLFKQVLFNKTEISTETTHLTPLTTTTTTTSLPPYNSSSPFFQEYIRGLVLEQFMNNTTIMPKISESYITQLPSIMSELPITQFPPIMSELPITQFPPIMSATQSPKTQLLPFMSELPPAMN